MLRDAKYGEVYLENAPDSAVDPSVEEPVFVIRGQDDAAVHIVTRYRNYYASITDEGKKPTQEFLDGLDEVIGQFANFRTNHADRVKVAD